MRTETLLRSRAGPSVSSLRLGIPTVRGSLKLRFVIPHSDTSRTVAEVVQEMWRRELGGARARFHKRNGRSLLAELDNYNFDVFMLGWIGDYMDPRTFLKIMRTRRRQ